VSELMSPPLCAAHRGAGLPGSGRGGFARSMVESIGNPSSAHIDHARGMLEAIPVEIRTAVGTRKERKRRCSRSCWVRAICARRSSP